MQETDDDVKAIFNVIGWYSSVGLLNILAFSFERFHNTRKQKLVVIDRWIKSLVEQLMMYWKIVSIEIYMKCVMIRIDFHTQHLERLALRVEIESR